MRTSIYIAIFLLAGINARAQSIVEYNFASRMDGVSILWTGDTLNFWGFRDLDDSTTTEAVLPGPTIYCNLGDSVIINMTNPSFEAHTIHLHGLDVDQANDGVPSTSFFIQPNQTGTYTFRATQSGNYLYHCHVGTVLHLQMGMYGAVIIRLPNGMKEVYPGGPQYDRDFEWLCIDVDKSWHDDYTSIGPFTNFEPDFFHINGKSRQDIAGDSAISIYNAFIGEKILLRLMNVGYGINRYLFPPGLNVTQITSDGRPLPNTIQSDTLRLYPGERYGILIEPTQLMSDSIEVQFLSMYRDKYQGSEFVPVQVNRVSKLNMNETRTPVIYPNPFENTFRIRNYKKGYYRITDMNGREQLNGDFNENLEIPAGKLISGIYVIQIFPDNESGVFRKLIKK